MSRTVLRAALLGWVVLVYAAYWLRYLPQR